MTTLPDLIKLAAFFIGMLLLIYGMTWILGLIRQMVREVFYQVRVELTYRMRKRKS